jgi:hypothetical protein
MLGHGHASSGLTTGLAVGDALALGPGAVIALGLAAAGACTLPDIDCARAAPRRPRSVPSLSSRITELSNCITWSQRRSALMAGSTAHTAA